MANLQEQIKEICNLADKVINDPNSSPKTIAKELGLSAGVVGLACGFAFAAAPISLLYHPGRILYLIWKACSNNKKKELEKERMLIDIIRKQLAIIRNLEQQNKKNKAEIENLKEMLRILEEAENKVKAA